MVIAKNAYDPYGIPASTNVDRFGYTGQTWLRELGLDYYKARMYSPRLGRFLQTDPIFYVDDMNMYGYVRNDPLNRFDPRGMNGEEQTCSPAPCTSTPEPKFDPPQIRIEMPDIGTIDPETGDVTPPDEATKATVPMPSSIDPNGKLEESSIANDAREQSNPDGTDPIGLTGILERKRIALEQKRRAQARNDIDAAKICDEAARRADFDYYKLLGTPLNIADYGPPTGLRK